MIKARRKFILSFFICVMTLLTLSFLSACQDDTAKSYFLPEVTEGETFEITLNAHGGTAYSWSYEINPSSGVEYVQMEYIPENNDPNWSGGGQLVYTFKATKVGTYKIKFELQIPWESKEPIETIIYELRIIK